MEQIQLINMVNEWDRGLVYEEERRNNHRFEPYVNYLAAPQQPCRKERKSIFARIFQGRQKSVNSLQLSVNDRRFPENCYTCELKTVN
jgi:hypothetical protein